MTFSHAIKIYTFLLITIFDLNSFGQTSPFKKIDQQLAQVYQDSRLPGFCIAIVGKDSIIYQGAFGYADVSKTIPYTVHTIQPLASVSKTFIGLALMKAIEDGYFTLESNINDLLPFKIINPYFPDKPIKVRHLATHTSGIVDRRAAYTKAYQEKKVPDTPLNLYLQAYFIPNEKWYSKKNFSNSIPGEEYHYTNIGSALAAYIIEYQTGKSFSAYTHEMIFDKIGMAATHWVYDENLAERYATLYKPTGAAWPVYSNVIYPDGSLRTSCRDLAIYLMEIIKGYQGESALLSPEHFKIMLSRQLNNPQMTDNMDNNDIDSGIFWAINEKGQVRHTGGDPGVSTFIKFDPETGRGLFLMFNADVSHKNYLPHFRRIIEVIRDFEGVL